jgi:hypothetical protein
MVSLCKTFFIEMGIILGIEDLKAYMGMKGYLCPDGFLCDAPPDRQAKAIT